MAEPIGVGVIGLGFMGQTHVRAWQGADAPDQEVRLVAVADRSAERLTGRVAATGNIETGGDGDAEQLFDPDQVRGYREADELLADRAVHVVSICTHTQTHVDLALRALAAGKHVLVEKPVAVEAAAVHRLAEAADHAASAHGLLCMPAMCIRYWPAYAWLAERVRDRSLGPVRSAVFQRLGTRPAWAPEFYTDRAKTGGALVDLHIHDADFITHCFGRPRCVSAVGDPDHLTTLYRYGQAGPAHVVAEGGWDHADGFGFVMRFTVNFEDATADFDLSRDPALRLSHAGEARAIQLPDATGYDMQVRALAAAIARKDRSAPTTIREAAAVADMLEAERQAIESGLPIELA